MINESFVSYDTAKLLKEAGFPQEGGYDCFFDKEDVRYSIPKQSQAMRWLREYRRIHIEIRYRIYDQMWDSLLRDMDGKIAIPQDDLNYVRNCQDFWVAFPTYEAAAEAGIQAACKYLIDK